MSTANNSILRAVSRSFYLSIRILPSRLRQPVALGYLLARSTDTVADTANIPVQMRIETLRKLGNMIQHGNTDRAASVDLVSAFAPLQTNTAEQVLLQSLPDILDGLGRLKMADQSDVRAVLEKITSGQLLDLDRFPDRSAIRALQTAGDLDEYTYLVAGCVGEFWTRVCFRHIDTFAGLGQDKMLALGREYGMGLQLINILRDAGNDLRAGRCYFPANELAAGGISPEQICREPEKFPPIYRNWIDKAERYVESGWEYSRAIKSRRVRAATVLPALIGLRTIALLREAGPKALEQTVKVSRPEVRRMVFSLAISFASRRQIDALIERRHPMTA
jgi:farnesyl-diphosphate farnesyltransferase